MAARQQVPIVLKSKAEIAKLREANLVVADVLNVVEAACKPGITTWELNEVAGKRLKQLKAESAFLGYHGFPAVLCTSVNEVIVHGIPRKDVVLKDGDIIGIDFGAFKDGWCGDAARTLAVGQISNDAAGLIRTTKEALDRALEICRPGKRLGDIGHAIQSLAESKGYSIAQRFCGHGIGRAMHEAPNVENTGRPNTGKRLSPGLVIAIEPMVNAGTAETEILSDSWTAVTKDRRLSAHFEHSVAITDGDPIVLSRVD